MTPAEWRALIIRCVIDLGVKRTARVLGVREVLVVEYERGLTRPGEQRRDEMAEHLRIALLGFWWKLPKSVVDRVNAPDKPEGK